MRPSFNTTTVPWDVLVFAVVGIMSLFAALEAQDVFDVSFGCEPGPISAPAPAHVRDVGSRSIALKESACTWRRRADFALGCPLLSFIILGCR